MSDPSPGRAGGPSLWQSVRDFLKLKGQTTLRESIEETIDEYESGSEGDMDATERSMLRNMLELSDRKVGEIAVPRSDIIAVEEDMPFPDIVRRFREAGHSRLPLYRGSLDAVLGMLLVKDVYAVLADHPGGARPLVPPTPRMLMRPMLFVPTSMPVMDLLTEMRRRRTHMAIVVDEYGGTDGLVTIEDIVEEIVGEIEDEHDEIERSLLTRLEDGALLADARIPLEDLEAEVGVALADVRDEHDVDTLGGLAFLLAGRVPRVGEVFAHPSGWSMEVVASDGRRIERLLLRPPGVAPEAESEAVD